MPRTVSATNEQAVEKKKDIKLTGDALISFISGTQTNIGRSTYYNMKDEQRQAMLDQHKPVLEQARPFYTLMSLSSGVNDANKQLIAWNLMRNPIRESGLKSNQHSPMTKWENEILNQILKGMQPNRVMDLFVELKNKKISKKRALNVIHRWLSENQSSVEFWAIKYRDDMKKILKFIRHNYKPSFKNVIFDRTWNYLRFNVSQNCSEIIQNYVAVQKGDKEKLAKLPVTVAEGFKKKFDLSDEEFTKLFTKGGGKFTAKEKRLKDSAVKRSSGKTGLDIRKLEMFDLLVYLKSQDTLPMSRKKIEELLDQKAKQIADKLLFEFEDVAVILDTTKSMSGTKEQPFHPMFRAMAISRILKFACQNYKEYRIHEDDNLFPKLRDQSNYADSVKQALKDGFKTIIIVGDGYENAPFEGALHQLVYAFKKKIDKQDKVKFFHLNPVFASEAMDVRALSNLAPQIGVREVKALNESLFLAVAKQQPMLAIKGYLKHLVSLQNEKAKELMPAEVKKLVNARKKGLLTQN